MAEQPTNETFVDGVGRARYSGGVVRLDFLSATEVLDARDAGREARVAQRLILSPEGFIRAYNAMQGMMNELLRAGVVTQQQTEEAASEAQAAGPTPGA